MPVDREDEIFLMALAEGAARSEALVLGDATSAWRDAAVGLLMDAGMGLDELMRREDVEEIEAHDALSGMRDAKHALDAAFGEVLSALDIRLGELRLEHVTSNEELLGLAQFLNRYHCGEFASLRGSAVVGQARRALDLAGHYRADARVSATLLDSVERFEAARRAAASEGAEAVQAYGELVEGRSVARICYLTARDLISAALRFEGRQDELDPTLPTLSTFTRVDVPDA